MPNMIHFVLFSSIFQFCTLVSSNCVLIRFWLFWFFQLVLQDIVKKCLEHIFFNKIHWCQIFSEGNCPFLTLSITTRPKSYLAPYLPSTEPSHGCTPKLQCDQHLKLRKNYSVDLCKSLDSYRYDHFEPNLISKDKTLPLRIFLSFWKVKFPWTPRRP